MKHGSLLVDEVLVLTYNAVLLIQRVKKTSPACHSQKPFTLHRDSASWTRTRDIPVILGVAGFSPLMPTAGRSTN